MTDDPTSCVHPEHRTDRATGRRIGFDPRVNEWQPCSDGQDAATTALELVRQATARKAEAEAADLEWREAIKAAIAAGVRVVDIAAAAGGIHVTRVYQIRDDRR